MWSYVYDIYSPRGPSKEEMGGLLGMARNAIPADQLWLNSNYG
ncbi:hypothetical protein [Chryseobacterium gleum]